jgi:exosortase A
MSTIATERAEKGGWLSATLLTALVVTAITAAFHETAWSMVDIWIKSETFAHGFLIIPIVLWLVWDKREELRQLIPVPDYRVLLLLPPVGFVWLLANMTEVQLVQQLAFVAILVLAVWTILGNSVARLLMFPLFFLFFAVPIGKGLILPLMNFTADFTVGMLKLTGIPVYREGTFFSIPSGSWSVVEGCSGVRYLIASVTLGTLYSYLTYSRLYKRLLFILFSFIVPIIANGLRAYMIVMIAHLSDMKLALGVDHLIYGWVFFGFVIFIMFFIGSFWRDEHEKKDEQKATSVLHKPVPGRRSVISASLLATVLAIVWPVIGFSIDLESGVVKQVSVVSPAGRGGWKKVVKPFWDWRPLIHGTDGESYQFYVKEGNPVGLYLGVYRRQRQDAELVSSVNIIAKQKDPVWHLKWQKGKTVVMADDSKEVIQSRVDSRDINLTVWHWYRLGDRYSSNPYVAKLLEAVARMTGSRQDAAMLVLASPYQMDPEDAILVLQDFLTKMLPGIERNLDDAVETDN